MALLNVKTYEQYKITIGLDDQFSSPYGSITEKLLRGTIEHARLFVQIQIIVDVNFNLQEQDQRVSPWLCGCPFSGSVQGTHAVQRLLSKGIPTEVEPGV